jgi:hypothetical protein
MKFTTNQMQYFTKFIQVHAIQNIILRIHSSLFMKRVALSYLQGEHGKTSFLSRWSAVHIRGSKKHRLLSCRACLILCITWSEWDIAKNQKSSYNFTKSYTKACNVSKANKVRCHALPKKRLPEIWSRHVKLCAHCFRRALSLTRFVDAEKSESIWIHMSENSQHDRGVCRNLPGYQFDLRTHDSIRYEHAAKFNVE